MGKVRRWRGGPTYNTPNRVKETAFNIAGWAKIRDAILERDNGACRICGTDDSFAALNVHHIDWDRRHNQDSNLVTLCSTCHQAVHREGYKPELYEDWPPPWGKIEPEN